MIQRNRRRAAVNYILLIVLGLAAVACIVFWITRSDGDNVGVAVTESTIYCSKCGPQKIPSDKLKKIKWDAQNRLQCPACNEFKASFTQSGQPIDMPKQKP